tara:strand:- start:132 stop:476 length:345 start_codon:yes stop_codon:yes gene_type:complete
MTFEENIQKWVLLDNQIKVLNDRVKGLREQKNSASESIMQHVETNSLSNATVRISDGQLKFTATRQTTPLTFRYIKDCLIKCINNPEQVEQIMNFIKESREIKHIPEIKRTYAN